MSAPATPQRHRALRWLLPAGVAGLAALAAAGVFSAGASSEQLPPTSPAALLAAVKQTNGDSFSGTVVSHLALGLPELPAIGDGDATLGSLLSGSHTLQVWYGGVDKQRVAVLGTTDETDVFRNGRDVWQWNSASHTAEHAKVPRGVAAAAAPAAAATTLTPAGLARRAIAAMNGSTKVSVDNQRSVADRSAYLLVLEPRTTATKVAAVHIEVDGNTKVPLGVQVYSRQSAAPAIDVAFTSINFGPQSDRDFQFTPPPSAHVVEHKQLQLPTEEPSGTARPAPRSTGSGWTAVVGLHPGKQAVAKYSKGLLAKATTEVSGSWGNGRLLDTPLVSVLITDDGRVYAGAVDADTLYAAAAK
jgi:outer membrane lipoprotein-sorting protein